PRSDGPGKVKSARAIAQPAGVVGVQLGERLSSADPVPDLFAQSDAGPEIDAILHPISAGAKDDRRSADESRVETAQITAAASACSISVTSAPVFKPSRRPTATSFLPSSAARRGSCMKAPEPHLTSSTKAPAPSATFFDRMLATINGMDSTVAVASRNA